MSEKAQSARAHYVPPQRETVTICGRALPRWTMDAVVGERMTRERGRVTCEACLQVLAGLPERGVE